MYLYVCILFCTTDSRQHHGINESLLVCFVVCIVRLLLAV